MTVSILSAMISRVCKENLIPSPPIVMASLTPSLVFSVLRGDVDFLQIDAPTVLNCPVLHQHLHN